jgi:hypothetical protein
LGKLTRLRPTSVFALLRRDRPARQEAEIKNQMADGSGRKAEMIESPQTKPGVRVRSKTLSFAAGEVMRLIILISNSKFRIPNLK